MIGSLAKHLSCGALVLTGLLLGACPSSAYADEPGAMSTADARVMAFRFARALESQGLPSEATHEYLAVLWLSGGRRDSLSLQAAEGVARSYAISGRFQETLQWGRNPSIAKWEPCERAGVDLEVARAMIRLGSTKDALQQAERLAKACPTNPAMSSAAGYLAGVARFRLGDWRSARNQFEALARDSVLGTEAARNLEVLNEAERFPLKSPRTAAWLGIVPGAGYWYAGFPKTAISALIVNALFAQATREAFRRDQDTLGWFMGVFTLSWYSGSIYGSAGSAVRYNAYHQDRFFDRIDY
jgi:hypothetical protein